MGVTSPSITGRRTLAVHRLSGTINWTVTEFDNGHSYHVTVQGGGGLSVAAHFTDDQWADFQQLVAGPAPIEVAS